MLAVEHAAHLAMGVDDRLRLDLSQQDVARCRHLCRQHPTDGLDAADASLRRRDGGEDGVDDVLDVDVVGDGLETEVQTVAEHGVAQRPQIVGQDERAAVQQGVGPAACCRAIAPRGLAPNSTYSASSGSMTWPGVASPG